MAVGFRPSRGCAQPYSGMVFNDVVILYPFPKGMPESLPSSIGQDQEMSHSVSLSLDDACNLNGRRLSMTALTTVLWPW